MARATPTARSLDALRKDGWTACVVERHLPRCHITQDAFGVGDILAARPGSILLVQTTSGSNLAARRTKALDAPGLRAWLEAGGRFVLHGWAKRGPAGARKTWQCRCEELFLADLDAATTPERTSARQSDDPGHDRPDGRQDGDDEAARDSERVGR